MTYRREECVLDEAWKFDKTNIHVRIKKTKNEGRRSYQTRALIHNVLRLASDSVDLIKNGGLLLFPQPDIEWAAPELVFYLKVH